MERRSRTTRIGIVGGNPYLSTTTSKEMVAIEGMDYPLSFDDKGSNGTPFEPKVTGIVDKEFVQRFYFRVHGIDIKATSKKNALKIYQNMIKS